MLCEKGSGSSSSSIVVVNIIFDRFAASTQVGFHSYRFDSFLSAYKINECMISAPLIKDIFVPRDLISSGRVLKIRSP